MTFAQSGHFAPTGEMIMQRGQIGVSQRWQRNAVSTPGCLAQSTMVATDDISSKRPFCCSRGLPSRVHFIFQRTVLAPIQR
jgi:hypothetical protein